MTVVRGPRLERDFSVFANAVLRDERLSFRARGLLTYVLSQPPAFKITSRALAAQAKEGREAIRTALAELEAVGYLVRTRHRNQRGQWVHVAVMCESAQETDAGKLGAGPTSDFAKNDDENAGQPKAQETDAGKLGDKSRRTQVEELEGLETVAPTGSAMLGFEDFWAVYPRLVARGEAKRKWDLAVKKAPGEVIIAGAVRFRDDPNRDPRFTPHPSTWLYQERWDDEPLPPRTGPATNGRRPDVVERNRANGDEALRLLNGGLR